MTDQHSTEALTIDTALGNAARLLHHAEVITDLALMERLAMLADSWIGIAALLTERDRT